MKINVVPTIVAVFFSALVAYGAYSCCISDKENMVAAGSGIMSLCMLVTSFGISLESKRRTANIKVVSIVFFMLSLIGNLIFALVYFSVPAYIITNGILLLVWLLIIYWVGKAMQ